MSRMARWFLPVLLAISLPLLVATGVSATSATGMHWHAGDGYTNIESPDIAKDPSNGATITLVGAGIFDPATSIAHGNGTFEHRDKSGMLVRSGTFVVTGFNSWAPYGCGIDGGVTIPANQCGGKLSVTVELTGHPASNPSSTITFQGTLVVTCLVGSPPTGADEGITLNIPGVANFSKSIFGETQFVSK